MEHHDFNLLIVRGHSPQTLKQTCLTTVSDVHNDEGKIFHGCYKLSLSMYEDI